MAHVRLLLLSALLVWSSTIQKKGGKLQVQAKGGKSASRHRQGWIHGMLSMKVLLRSTWS